MTGRRWASCIDITSLVILLKNAPSLSMSARHSKNRVLTSTMWNVIDPNSICKLTNSIDIALLIPNIKLADPSIFLSSWTKISSYCNALSWPMPLVDRVETFESISNPLNSILLYWESVDELKI